ncbi:hypothetical protein QNH23_06420 [Siminovitchia fortis]|uniref:Uncharacterized protein n=1 Tax=Siminovitchia fortis TaxID=254758 RepID=A0A443IMC7_9BACI|nr:hypothetical protein [Siminovitchia fortis]RWR06738.1 hypothetical protein D4N35_013820 [Siminovitchia fortis]WHY83006.1 hypothetical protein QNH23_06420 [Siminovitchia fortis]
MKKYSVYALLKNGQDIQFETDTNIKVAMPVMIDGARFLVTKEEIVLNLDEVEKLEMVQIK